MAGLGPREVSGRAGLAIASPAGLGAGGFHPPSSLPWSGVAQMKHALLPNSAGEASVVSLRHRYLLIVNSKTAGTTLKTVAAHLEREPLATLRAGREEGRAQRAENW